MDDDSVNLKPKRDLELITSSGLLRLDSRRLFHQQSLEIYAVRQDIVADVVTPDA